MSIAQNFLAELKQEAIATRKILEAVPMDKTSWKPHDKSMTLGRLAVHVAEIPGWFVDTLDKDELDFSTGEYKPFEPKSTAELIAYFDKELKRAEEVLHRISDDEMQRNWTMRSGDQIFFTLPKVQVARTWCLNHWYHHRAQLGVYLRLNNVALPGTYGPSADAN